MEMMLLSTFRRRFGNQPKIFVRHSLRRTLVLSECIAAFPSFARWLTLQNQTFYGKKWEKVDSGLPMNGMRRCDASSPGQCLYQIYFQSFLPLF
jgi:hypothetical protein